MDKKIKEGNYLTLSSLQLLKINEKIILNEYKNLQLLSWILQ